jgi:hypothetical protein
LRSWFAGHEAVGRFLADCVFPERWRHRLATANGQLAVAGYLLDAERGCFVAAALDVLDLRAGKIAAVTGFLTAAGVAEEPGVPAAGERLFARFGLPGALPTDAQAAPA